MKSTTSVTVRQLACYWLLWLLVGLISLLAPHSQLISPEHLLAPAVRRGDVTGALFPWRLERSNEKRSIRLPQWLTRLMRQWTLFRQMRRWNMAQWVDVLTRHQLCKRLGALLILYPLLEELEVAEIVNQYCPTEAEVDHGTVAVVLALNRLTAPRPLYKIADWMTYSILSVKLGVPSHKFNDDRLARTLDALAPHLRDIWLEVASRALDRYDIDLSVIFYDLTAFVMMGRYEDSDLADFGFAHNTPMNKRKVKLAGNATQDGGLLFDWAALSGQVADTATVEDNLRRLSRVLRQQDWPVEEVLVVGDRAMLNNRLAIIYEDHKPSLRYLAGLEPRKTEHQDLLADVPLRELREHYLMGQRGHRYWGVKRPITFVYKDEETGTKEQATHTALVVLSEATRRSWRRQRIQQLRELSIRLQREMKDKLNQPYWRNPDTIRKRAQSHLDDSPVGEVMKVKVWGEYGDVHMQWDVDRAALRELCRLDGRYLLVTNDATLTPTEMLSIYKDKDQIEKRFRVAKQVLQVRPIYLHKDRRIEAMLLVNMIALLTYSLAERRCRRSGLEITGRQLLYEFAPLHITETHCWDGSILYRCMPLTPRQQEILQAMGIASTTWRAMLGDEPPGQLNLPPPGGQHRRWPAGQAA